MQNFRKEFAAIKKFLIVLMLLALFISAAAEPFFYGDGVLVSVEYDEEAVVSCIYTAANSPIAIVQLNWDGNVYIPFQADWISDEDADPFIDYAIRCMVEVSSNAEEYWH